MGFFVGARSWVLRPKPGDVRSLIAAALATLLAGCATTAMTPESPRTPGRRELPPVGSAGPAGPAELVEVEDLAERALLLMLADRRLYEGYAVQKALAGGARTRRLLAESLGRIGDPRGIRVLSGLLLDDAVEVRRAAAFALGELEAPEGRRALLAAVDDPDRKTGGLAVEALAKTGAPVLVVAEALTPLADEERWARLLPSLFRFQGEEILPLAEAGLRSPDAELHRRAAYALSRNPRPESASLLRPLLADPDPWVSAWAARALGEVGRGVDLALMLPLLEGAEAGPIVQTLRAARRLIDEGKASAPDAWRRRLIEILASPEPHLRLTALDAAASWLQDEEIGGILVSRALSSNLAESAVALVALARGAHPRASELVEAARRSSQPALRTAAAEATAHLGSIEDLKRLAGDPSARVRIAAVEGLLRLAGRPEKFAIAALTDGDPGLTASVYGWLIDNPVLAVETLALAVKAALGDGNVESSLQAVRALAARAESEPLERGTLVAILENLGASEDYLVRREASSALAALGAPAPAAGSADTRRALPTFGLAVQRTVKERLVELHTDRGTVRLRLDCPRAPLTCLNFLHLGAQGFYDGLTFHRVVPDFVVQAGDPRGDGWGGPRYTIRDEINDLRYRRGVVGMALAGADTGGSQFFITLSPQPHLDGGYTAFGEVVDGFEVLERIVPGDRIVGFEELQ